MSKDTKAPSRTAEQFVIRFPHGMRDRIADEAKRNNRSMNAEIVARIEASFDAPTLQLPFQMSENYLEAALRMVRASGPSEPPPISVRYVDARVRVPPKRSLRKNRIKRNTNKKVGD